MRTNHIDLLSHKSALTTKYADTTTVKTCNKKISTALEYKYYSDIFIAVSWSHHFSLLLLLVLQLNGHQSVVELGELPPHHLDLVVHAEAGLKAVPRPEAGVPVHAASPLYPCPAPASAHPIDQLVPVLRGARGRVIAHLTQLYGSKQG